MECIEMRFGNVRGASVSDVHCLNSKPGGGCGIVRSSTLFMQIMLASGLSPDRHGLGAGNLPKTLSIHENQIVISIYPDSEKPCDTKVNS